MGAEEGVESTVYDKILKAKSTKTKGSEMGMEKINRLIESSHQNDNSDEIIELLSQIIPTYKPSQNELRANFW